MWLNSKPGVTLICVPTKNKMIQSNLVPTYFNCFSYKKRTIDFGKTKTFGLSEGTAIKQFGGICGIGCGFLNETDRGQNCIDCSHQIAKRDLGVMDKYKANITLAANEKCFPAPLLAAFISRQTQGGAELDGTDGWIDCHNSNQRCFGLMHTPQCKLGTT